MLTVDVPVCPRCGSEHGGLIAKTIDQPIVGANGVVYDQWALCPITDDPILVRRDIASVDTDQVTLIGLRQAWLWAKYEPLVRPIPDVVDLSKPSAREDIKFLVDLIGRLLDKGVLL